MQEYGLTRNESPVYFMYPPDPSGRRANQANQLQYAGPSQRAAYDTYTSATRARGATTPQSSKATPQTTSARQDQGPISRNTATSQVDDGYIVRTASDYTSSESSNGSNPHQHTPRTRTMLWSCCRGRDSDHGPYNVRLCCSCLSCGHQPCQYCRREVVVVRDRSRPTR